MAQVHTPVLEFSRRIGLLDLVGEDHIYPTVDAAVNAIEAASAYGFIRTYAQRGFLNQERAGGRRNDGLAGPFRDRRTARHSSTALRRY
jgi:hypothetical protein